MNNLSKSVLLASLLTGCENDYRLSNAKSNSEAYVGDANGYTETDPIPPFPFSTAIQSCLELNKTACPVDFSEGGLEPGCLERAEENTAIAEEQILKSAKEFTGNDSLTIEDIKAGRVSPATVYASNFTEDSIANPTLQFSFGNNASAYENYSSEADKLSIDTIRCSAKLNSEDEIESVTNSFVKADQSEPADLSIFDFTIDGGSNNVTVYDNGYDSTNQNFLFDSTFEAIDGTGVDISETAKAFAGEGEALFVY